MKSREILDKYGLNIFQIETIKETPPECLLTIQG